MALLGVGMGLFNLIPLSPLDGSKILFALLPDRIYYTILRYEKYVMGVVILLVLVGVFDKPLSFLMVHVLQGFCTLTGMPLGGLLLFQDASAILNLFCGEAPSKRRFFIWKRWSRPGMRLWRTSTAHWI